MLNRLLHQRQWVTFNEEIRKRPPLSDTDKYLLFNTACAKRDIDCSSVKALIEAGFFIRLPDEKDTVVYHPIRDGRLDILRLLISHTPDLLQFVDKDGNTLLHYASSSGNVEVAEFLLTNFDQNQINAKNKAGKSALDNVGSNKQMRQMIAKYQANCSIQ